MASQDHITDLIPGYALDCLDPDEKLIAEAHLAVCSDCQAELAVYQNVVAEFPLAVPEMEPPAGLKSRILEKAAHQKPAQVESLGFLAAFTRPIQQLFANLSRSPGFAFASLAVVILLAAGNLLLFNQFNRQNQAQREGMRTLDLTGTDNAPGAYGIIVISADGADGTLVVDGLTELGEEQEYQLWLIRDGQRESGGTFNVGQDGYGGRWIYSPQPLGIYQAFGITIEPAGGSPGPTGPKVLGGEF